MSRNIVPPLKDQFVEDEGGLTARSFQFLQLVSALDPIRGDGSPEGIVEARIPRFYVDVDSVNGCLLYVKQFNDIGGDRTQGWTLISCGSGGGGDVSSVFGRTGNVIAVSGDYEASEVTNAFDLTVNTSDDVTEGITNLYFSIAEQNKLSGIEAFAEVNTIDSGDNVSLLVNNAGYLTDAPNDGSQYARQNGAWAIVAGGGGAVTSVFTRTGAVVAQSGDYTAAQVTNAFDTTANDSDDITEGATNLFFTSAEQIKLSGIETGAEVNTINSGDNVSLLVNDAGYLTSAPVISVNTQTGTVVLTASDVGAFDKALDTSDDITEGSTNLFFTGAERTKLSGIATGAEVNTIDSGDNVSLLVNDAGYTTSTGTVTSVGSGTGLTGGPITGSGTINLANTAVTPGAYTSADITVDAQGRVTAASNGSGGGGGTTVTFFQVQDDGTTGQLTTGTAADLAGMWATPSLTDADFSWNGTTGILTANQAGTIEFDIKTTGWNNANNRHELHVQLYKNGSTVLVEDAQYASRNGTQDEGSAYICGFKDTCVATDTYRIRVFHIGVAATIGAANVSGMTYLSAKIYS